MSTLTVTNIKATGETASRAVSGVAAMHCGFNMNPSTQFGMSVDTLSSQAFNASSFTDNATGDCSVGLINEMSNTGFSFLSGTASVNNTTTIGTTSTTSSLRIRMNDADTSTDNNSTGWVALFGDLA